MAITHHILSRQFIVHPRPEYTKYYYRTPYDDDIVTLYIQAVSIYNNL